MISKFSYREILRVAAYTGIVCSGGILYMFNNVRSKFKEGEHFKISMSTLRAHAGAVHYLGEPIDEGNVDLGNTKETFITRHRARLAIPVRGSKQKGILHSWCLRDENDAKKWRLMRLELELQELKDRKMLVFKTPEADEEFVDSFYEKAKMER